MGQWDCVSNPSVAMQVCSIPCCLLIGLNRNVEIHQGDFNSVIVAFPSIKETRDSRILFYIETGGIKLSIHP